MIKTVAVHEAGHAFGAYLANWKVKTVSVLHANGELEEAKTDYDYGLDTPLVHRIETYLSNPKIFHTLDKKEQDQVLEILDRRLILAHSGPIAEQKLNNVKSLIDVFHQDSEDLKRIDLIQNFQIAYSLTGFRCRLSHEHRQQAPIP